MSQHEGWEVRKRVENLVVSSRRKLWVEGKKQACQLLIALPPLPATPPPQTQPDATLLSVQNKKGRLSLFLILRKLLKPRILEEKGEKFLSSRDGQDNNFLKEKVGEMQSR